jgi:glucokinase
MSDPTWVIGIDVGGTKIAGGLVRFPDGTVSEHEVVPTLPARGPEAVLADVIALAGRVRAKAPTSGLGLGVAELVDRNGRVTSGATIDWRGVDLQDRLSEFGPVVIEADVRAAALAEARFGAGRPFRLFLYVTVGTGISSTLVIDGRPFAGARGNALAFASSPWRTECEACGAASGRVLEEVASGPALAREYRRRTGRECRAEEVLMAATVGEPVATGVARTGGAALGNGVAVLVNALDPEAVVVGGGLGLADGPYHDAFVQAVRELVWSDVTRELPLLRAATGTAAGVIGAAVAVRERATSRVG